MTDASVRAVVAEDLPRLLEIYNYYVETTHHTSDLELSTPSEFEDWFSQFHSTGPHRALVCECEGILLGYASSREFHPKKVYSKTVEVGLYVAHQHHARGVGSLLYAALFEALASEPSVHQMVAGITLPNEASLALHRKYGFREVATFKDIAFQDDRYWSLRWMIRLARPDEAAPSPSEVVQSNATRSGTQ